MIQQSVRLLSRGPFSASLLLLQQLLQWVMKSLTEGLPVDKSLEVAGRWGNLAIDLVSITRIVPQMLHRLQYERAFQCKMCRPCSRQCCSKRPRTAHQWDIASLGHCQRLAIVEALQHGQLVEVLLLQVSNMSGVQQPCAMPAQTRWTGFAVEFTRVKRGPPP